MGTLDSHSPCQFVKLMNVCDSGGGKTGALASLIKAGYSLRIADYDNGLQILKDLLSDEEQNRVYVETLVDPIKPGIKEPQFLSATAFSRFCQLLNNWKDEANGIDLGPLKSWDDACILVIDSFTAMNEAILRYVQQTNKRLNEHASQHEYGLAMDRVQTLLEFLKSPKATPCHVIINCHLKYVRKPGSKIEFEKHGQGEIEMTPLKAYPRALGSALPPIVSSFFNTMISMSMIGKKRFIELDSTDEIYCKNPVPSVLKGRLPIEDGMATIFEKILRKKGPTQN